MSIQVELALKILTYVTVCVSVIATLYEVMANTKTHRATYWLRLREYFEKHDDIHRSLQADKTWRSSGRTVTQDEAISIVSYMGAFEHCYIAMKEKLIDKQTFIDIYYYRICVLMESPVIVRATLVENGRYWSKFRTLVEEMGYSLPEREDMGQSPTDMQYPVGWSGEFKPSEELCSDV